MSQSPIKKSRLALIVASSFLLSRLIYWAVAKLVHVSPVSGLCQWDCSWYISIANRGYDIEPHGMKLGDAANWVFFPLYPLVMDWVAALTGLTHEMAGIALSNVLIILAAWVGVRYLEASRENVNPVVFVSLCMFGPFSFYFATVYSEALFLLLLFFSLLNWSSERHFTAAIFAALLSATRSVGVFWVMGMAASLLHRYGKGTVKAVLNNPVYLVAGVVAPLGLFLFMLYLYFHVGDALAFKHAQVAWSRELHNPFPTVIHSLMAMDLSNLISGDIPDSKKYSATYLAIFAVLGMGLLVVPLVKKYWFEFVFGCFALFIPMVTSLQSTPRFLVGAGVFLFAVHDLIARSRYYFIWLLLLGMSNIWLLSNWYLGAEFLT